MVGYVEERTEGTDMDSSAAAGGIASVVRPLVDGVVLTAGEAGYDRARTPFFAHRIGRPAAVVRPKHVADVAATVDVARRTGTSLFVRSGGHTRHSSGDGLLLDLGDLTAVDVDVSGRTAWAGSGLTAREVAAELDSHGSAVGFGDTASVGIGGITLGGGIGFLGRLHGLTIDNVVAAEIVTADGTIRTVDASREPELFWAIRGGGGNFGVVTRFCYRLARIDRVYGGLLVLPATPGTISELVDASTQAVDAVTTIANILPAPPLPGLPEEVHGRPVIAARICYAGDPRDGERVLRPLRELGGPVADLLGPMRYADLLEEAPDRGQSPAIRTMFLDRVDMSVATTMLDHLRRDGSWLRLVQIRVLGGAIDRVAADATAYAHRASPILVNLVHGTERSAIAARQWTRDLADALYQGYDGAYVGFLGPDEEHRVAAAYPGETLARLRRVKAAYDAANIFRNNVNIAPADG